jgi:hypothetical protein
MRHCTARAMQGRMTKLRGGTAVPHGCCWHGLSPRWLAPRWRCGLHGHGDQLFNIRGKESGKDATAVADGLAKSDFHLACRLSRLAHRCCRFRVGRGHQQDHNTDAGNATVGASPTNNSIGQLLALEGESIYEGLDLTTWPLAVQAFLGAAQGSFCR